MQRYKELVEVARKYYPRDRGYCTVIALAVVTGWAFGKARSVMYRQHGRTDRKGSTVTKLNAEIAAQGFKVVERDKALYGKTLKTIQRSNNMSMGTFLIYTAKHVTVMKDGKCEDWSNNEIRPSLYKIESVYEVI
jgi:hypothetical protein